jgi:hypothetical protein
VSGWLGGLARTAEAYLALLKHSSLSWRRGVLGVASGQGMALQMRLPSLGRTLVVALLVQEKIGGKRPPEIKKKGKRFLRALRA